MAVAVVAGVWAGVRATLGRLPAGQSGFLWWVVNRLMFLAAITSIQGFAPFFLMYAFGVNAERGAAMTGQLMTVVGILTLASALPAGWLADRLGQRRLLGLSGLLAAAGAAVLLVAVWLPELGVIYLAGGLLGLATGFFVTVNWALGTRLVPPQEAGRYLGVSNLAGAGAGMIGSGIGGPLADLLNASLPGLGYFVIFSGYLLLFLFSSLSLLGVRAEAASGPHG
jgi:MFS family permease